MSSHVVLHRLYPGEEGEGDRKSEAAALRARTDRVIANQTDITEVWLEGAAAAKDAEQRATRSQRRMLNLIEIYESKIARARRFGERGARGSAVQQVLNSKPADLRHPKLKMLKKKVHAFRPAAERPSVNGSCLRVATVSTTPIHGRGAALPGKMDKLSTAGQNGLRVRHSKALLR